MVKKIIFSKLVDGDYVKLMNLKKQVLPLTGISTISIFGISFAIHQIATKFLFLTNPFKRTRKNFIKDAVKKNKGIFLMTFTFPVFMINLFYFSAKYINERNNQYQKYLILSNYYAFYKDQEIVKRITNNLK